MRPEGGGLVAAAADEAYSDAGAVLDGGLWGVRSSPAPSGAQELDAHLVAVPETWPGFHGLIGGRSIIAPAIRGHPM